MKILTRKRYTSKDMKETKKKEKQNDKETYEKMVV